MLSVLHYQPCGRRASRKRVYAPDPLADCCANESRAKGSRDSPTKRQREQDSSGGDGFTSLALLPAVIATTPAVGPKVTVPWELLQAKKRKDHSYRMLRFLETCYRHEDFITSSAVVDDYLLSMTSIHLKRAGLNALGYTKDRYFFYALYLAIETEEDMPRGTEEILVYLLGPPPSGGDSCAVGRSKQLCEWERRLQRFLSGKDKFWAKLDYRTWLSEEKCSKEISRFPPHAKLVHRRRTQADLANW